MKLYTKGIYLREIKKGEHIGTKTMYRVKEGDFIFSKNDARNDAYGFDPPELDCAVVSSNFPILNLRKNIESKDYVSLGPLPNHIQSGYLGRKYSKGN